MTEAVNGIEVRDLSVKLDGETVVRDASLSLKGGGLNILIGPNGAGKTTLLKAMAGLLEPFKGEVQLDGHVLAHLLPAQRAAHMAYLPQDRSIAWDLSSVEVAALGATDLTPEQARPRAFERLQSLGLQEVADRGVFGLSGGQRARVLLARVLCSPAKLYLLDEPLIALDPAWQRQVLVRLREQARNGHTILLSLHDLHLAAQFADQILLMHRGQLVQVGTPEKVLTARALADVFNLTGELVHERGQTRLRLDSLPLL